jgi:hypothetical protein
MVGAAFDTDPPTKKTSTPQAMNRSDLDVLISRPP